MEKNVISKQHRLYGDLLCNFASATTSDEAGKNFLADMMKTFNFSDKTLTHKTGEDFFDEDDQFPTMEAFKDKSIDKNKKLNKIQKKIINDFIGKHPSHLHYGTHTTTENVFPKIKNHHYIHVMMSPIIYYSPQETIRYLGKGKIQSREVGTSGSRSEEIKGEWVDHGKGLKTYESPFDKKIKTVCKHFKLSDEETDIVHNKLYYYFEVLEPEHNHIDRIRNELRDFLNVLVDTKRFNETVLSTLYKYNTIYAENNFHQFYINAIDNGSINIQTNPLFNAHFWFNRLDTCPHLNLESYYDHPIAFCLVEFFKEQDNKEYLCKCSDCRSFFLKAKLYQKQKYCSICSRKNHTPKQVQAERTRRTRAETNKRKEKKKKEEEEKREALYENEYKRLIEAGYSKEGARQKTEDYVIEQMPVIE